MKKAFHGFILVTMLFCLFVNLSGCAALKKKFTPKKKEKTKYPIYYQVKKYEVEPSIELYEKHYVFWINWHRKLIDELGINFKNDIRSTQEMIGHLEDMSTLLEDEKAILLTSHINKIRKTKIIIDKRYMTKVNETRIRRLLEREYRIIRRDFSPLEMSDHIRQEWEEFKVE